MGFRFKGSEGDHGETAGQINVSLELRDGALEAVLPAHFTSGSDFLTVHWVDYYR